MAKEDGTASRYVRDLRIGVFVFVPLILGRLINTALFGYHLPLFASVVFLAFWIWVGALFARMSLGAITNYLLGTSISALSLLLYVWQFFLLDAVDRSPFIAALSQYYGAAAGPVAARLWLMLRPGYIDNRYFLITYLLLVAAFSVGFFCSRRRGRR